MFFQRLFFSLLLIFFLLAACAETQSTSSGESYMDGTWLTSCQSSYKKIVKIVINGSAGTEYDYHYSNSSCSDSSKYLEKRYYWKDVKYGDEITFNSGGKGRRFSTNMERVTFIPLTSDFVIYLNYYGVCGFWNWSLNSEKEVSGRSCSGVAYPPHNTSLFNLYMRSGNNAWIGTSSATGYPSSQDLSVTYVKQ